MRTKRTLTALMAVAIAAASTAVSCGEAKKGLGYQDTPIIPGQKWHVHDGERPQPTVITPGTSSTQDAPGKPPSDAIVLFDGKDLSKWRDGKGNPSGWKVENGYVEVPPKNTPGGGQINTRDEFGDCQLHIEWCTPTPPKGTSQGRGNSDVFFMGRYGIQVLDSYEDKTYPDGQAASIYGQRPPLVNACRKPGEWQEFDILFTAPRFEEGKLVKPAHFTVLHNGVVVHNHTEVLGPEVHRRLPEYKPHGPKGPIALQDHGNPVRFRNIWIRELKDYDQP